MPELLVQTSPPQAGLGQSVSAAQAAACACARPAANRETRPTRTVQRIFARRLIWQQPFLGSRRTLASPAARAKQAVASGGGARGRSADGDGGQVKDALLQNLQPDVAGGLGRELRGPVDELLVAARDLRPLLLVGAELDDQRH